MAPIQYPQLQDEAWLTDRYVTHSLSAQRIADEVGCTKFAVYHALDKFGMKKRRHSSRFPQLNDKDWLREQYIDKGLSTVQIAGMVGSTVGNVGAHLRAAGIPLRSAKEGLHVRFDGRRLGPDAANWRGGRRVTATGYVLIYAPDHPRAGVKGAVQEHILVMEQKLGRYLEADEVVHHRNHVRDDNRPENLEVVKAGEHIANHWKAGRDVVRFRARIEYLEGLLRQHNIPFDQED